MEKTKPVCLRCGYCCRGSFAIIPKTENSDLSKTHFEYLEKKHGKEYVRKYIAKNSESLYQIHLATKIQNLPKYKLACKWLIQDYFEISDHYAKLSPSSCKVYDKRSGICTNYKKGIWCNIGISLWKLHQESGNKIPEEILKLLKQHPDYREYFPEK